MPDRFFDEENEIVENELVENEIVDTEEFESEEVVDVDDFESNEEPSVEEPSNETLYESRQVARANTKDGQTQKKVVKNGRVYFSVVDIA